jgi:phytoene dehydrogenase-like protein
MQNLDLKPFYDVTIIGAGVGGLTAAALLSKAGFSVCILEKEPHVGGYLAGFRRRDFRFDTAIHWLNQCHPEGLVGRIFDILGKDHPVAVAQKRIRRYKGDSFDYLLTHNPDELKDRLISEFPAEQKGIRRFFRAARRLGRSFKNYSRVFRTEETMSLLERAVNKLRLLEFAIPFIPYISYTGKKGLQKGLNRFFRERAIHNLFASETELLSCLVPIGWAYYGDFQSPPKGGGQVIPEWLLHLVEYYHNEVHCKCKVKEILLDGNRCRGVSFEHRGIQYETRSRYVIAACDVETVYEKMLPAEAIPAKLKRKLRSAQLYSSSVTVSIALDCPAQALGFNEELVHLVSENQPFEVHQGGDPLKSEISILAPSLRDPSLAPAGMGTLVLFMPA